MNHTSRPSEAPRAPRRADFALRGFSLVEIVVVVVIVSVFAAIAVPRYTSSLSRYRVESAARRLAADLGLAQARARASGSFRNFVFTRGAQTYTIMEESMDGHRVSVSLDAEPYGVSASAFSTTDGNKTIVFDGYGQAAQGLSITLASGAHTRTVTLDQASGGINVATP